MTVLLANIALVIPFLVAFIAVPLWITFKHPDSATDHLQARRYLRARAAHEQAELTRAAHQKAA
jgi:hypothetical protein